MLDAARSNRRRPDSSQATAQSDAAFASNSTTTRKSESAPVETQSAVTRLDPLTGHSTIFAPSRDKRPNQFQTVQAEVTEDASCPFCRGSESETPSAVWVGRSLDGVGEQSHSVLVDSGLLLSETECTDDPNAIASFAPNDWTVRVVPNKFPAISADDSVTEVTAKNQRSPLFQEKPIVGGHEVIVESPKHHKSIVDLDVTNVALIFAAYRDRIRYWSRQPKTQYISVFKNAGGDAGASLAHSHSQLVASSVMPASVQSMVHRMNQHKAQTGCCLLCDLVRAELKSGVRVIAKTKSLVAYCPFASRLPMTVRITTMNHKDRFEDFDDEDIESVSHLVMRVASWLERLRPGVAYNYLLHTRPPGLGSNDSFHWSLELFPRLTRIAGFEFSSDCMINPVMPEAAAAEYRHCALAEDPRLVL